MSAKELKDELEKLVQNSKTKGLEIVSQGGSVTQWGQGIVDLSNASYKVIQYPPPPGFDWQGAISSWQRLNEQQDAVIASLERMTAPSVYASGTAAAYSMTSFANPSTFSYNIPIEYQDEARNAAERLGQVLDKLADKEKVSALLKQFELNRAAPGKRSSIELFETAWAAFERPVTTNSAAITSLVPIRECIKQTIETLLRRRPKQEFTRNEHSKIASIGNQLAYDGTAQAEIESWATRWSEKGGLLDELSASKNKALSREEWHSSLRRATLFLQEMLRSLDPAKLR